jgi:hypothetical protein
MFYFAYRDDTICPLVQKIDLKSFIIFLKYGEASSMSSAKSMTNASRLACLRQNRSKANPSQVAKLFWVKVSNSFRELLSLMNRRFGSISFVCGFCQ